MRKQTNSMIHGAISLVLVLSIASAGCVISSASPKTPGLPDYQANLAGLVRSPGLVDVPGGVYNVPGGNFMHRRVDLSADAGRRTHEISRVYNSVTGNWSWNFEVSYDGSTFIDESGARYQNLDLLGDGDAVVGSVWDKASGNAMRTRGGLLYSFDAQGRLASVFWDFPGAPGIRYDWSGSDLWVMQCFDANACVIPLFRVQLGSDGPIVVTDERAELVAGLSRRVEYTYTGGRLVLARSPEDVAQSRTGTQYRYKPMTDLIEEIENSHGEIVGYAWADGRLFMAANGGLQYPKETFGFPRHSLEVPDEWSVIHYNPLGGRTRIVYTSDGRWLSSERIDANEIASAFYPTGALRPSVIVAFDGTSSQINSYLDDEPVSVSLPSGNTINTVYEPAGINFGEPGRRAVSSVADALGQVVHKLYDGLGRPIEFTNGEGETSTLEYYPGASPRRIDSPGALGIEVDAYALSGHWTRGAHASFPDFDIQRKFDAVGNAAVIAAGLQRGGVLEQGFDVERRLGEIRLGDLDELGVLSNTDALTIQRRSDGKILSVKRPSGVSEHRSEYDSLGRRSSQCEVSVGQVCQHPTTFSYNAAGQVTSVTRPNGNRQEWSYDTHGRRVAHRALRNGIQLGERTWSWELDRVVTHSDSLAGESAVVSYDSAGRVEEQIISGVALHSVRREYDVRSRIIKETMKLSGNTIADFAFEYDRNNRRTLTRRLDGAAAPRDLIATQFVDGRVEQTQFASGLTRFHEYDTTTGVLIGTQTTDASGGMLEDTEIDRTVEAGPSRYQIRTHTVTPLADFGEVYWLNRPGNPTTDAGKLGMRVFHYAALEAGTVVDERSYAWDTLGRMADDSDGDTFDYDAVNGRLQNATVDGTPRSRVYDEAGDVVNLDGLEVERNALGRIVRLGPAGSPTVSMTWDMAGRRRSMTVGSVARTFSLFGGALEYDATSGTLGWLHLAGVSLDLASAGERYRHLDFRGNTLLTTDEMGVVVTQRRYQPFGVDAVAGFDGINAGDQSGFAGGAEIPSAGLVLLGARVLDPVLGLFLSQDPVRSPMNLLNPYSYAHGNPVLWWDPDGGHATPAGGDGPSGARVAAEFAAASFDFGGDVLLGAALFAGIQAARFAGAGPAGTPPAAGFAAAALVLSGLGTTAKLVAGGIQYLSTLFDIAESADAGSAAAQRKELTLEAEGDSGSGVLNLPGTAPPSTTLNFSSAAFGFQGFGWFAF